MSAASVIFPHQLFEINPLLKTSWPIYLVEEPLFFTQYKFHKQKLVFHRASMRAYQNFLNEKGYEVIYIEAKDKIAETRNLFVYLKEKGIDEIHYCDTVDNWLEKRIELQAKTSNLKIVRYESLLFLLNNEQVERYFAGKKKFNQTDFYTHQRKYFKILVDDKLQPEDGKWIFDTENRLKYPKNKKPPTVQFPRQNDYWKEAVDYVNKNFADHYGESNSFIYDFFRSQ